MSSAVKRCRRCGRPRVVEHHYGEPMTIPPGRCDVCSTETVVDYAAGDIAASGGPDGLYELPAGVTKGRGGWYELPDGRRVQGEARMLDAMGDLVDDQDDDEES